MILPAVAHWESDYQTLLRTNAGSTRLCEQKHCLAILFALSPNLAYALSYDKYFSISLSYHDWAQIARYNSRTEARTTRIMSTTIKGTSYLEAACTALCHSYS
jgi:hypothetical protein